MNQIIRPAQSEDRDRIIEISSKIWDGFDYVPYVFDKWILDSGEFSVLVVDDIIVGFAKLTILRDGELWLEGIRVDLDYKAKGYGKIIADYQIELAKKTGFETLELGTFVENVESLSIIEKRGFEKITSFKFFEINFPDYDSEFLTNIEIKGSIRPVEGKDIINRIISSNSLKDQLGYLTFDWTFMRADEELLERLICMKHLYIYEFEGKSNLFIYTNYMAKTNNRFLSYVENTFGLNDILTYTIRNCINDKIDSFSFMSKPSECFKKQLETKKFITYTDLEVDSYVYRYKG